SPLLRHELQSERSPNRVFDAFLQEQKIWCTESVIIITAERQHAVQVLPTQCLLKVEGNNACSRGDRFRQQQVHVNAAIQIPRPRNRRAQLPPRRTGVWTKGFRSSRYRPPIQRISMVQIYCPARSEE